MDLEKINEEFNKHNMPQKTINAINKAIEKIKNEIDDINLDIDLLIKNREAKELEKAYAEKKKIQH